MIIKKGEMVLNIEWSFKVNETKKYEQYIVAGYLPERVKQFGKRYIKLPKQWFFGQAEKEKKTNRWIKDSIRIVRIPENLPAEEREKLILRLGNVFLWFLSEATKKTFALVDDRFNMLALFGRGIGRNRLLDEISKIRSKYLKY